MKSKYAILFRNVSNLACASVFLLVFTNHTRAATINWDGDNSVGNFSYNNNWYGDSAPSWVFTNDLQFNYNNALATSLYYDLGAWNNISTIAFQGTWSGNVTWDGNGNGINFNQKLENYSTATVTLGTIQLSGGKNGASSIELNPVNGNIVVAAPQISIMIIVWTITCMVTMVKQSPSIRH